MPVDATGYLIALLPLSLQLAILAMKPLMMFFLTMFFLGSAWVLVHWNGGARHGQADDQGTDERRRSVTRD